MRRLALLLVLALAAPAAAEIIDGVVAVVNDEVITLSELDDTARPLLAPVAGISDPIERDRQRNRIRREALDQLIGKHLVAQEAARRNITIGPEAIDAHLDRIKASQGWTDDQLRMYLSSQGIAMSQFRSEVRENLLQQRVVGAVIGGRVRIGEGDLRDYYNEKLTQSGGDYQIEAAHIVLTVPQNASPAEEAATRRQAEELLARARSGEDFAALARQYSQAPGAEDGGYLGIFQRGTFEPRLEKALEDLPVGGIAGPVRTGFGYHIVRLIDRKKTPPKPFEEVQDELRRELQNKRLAEELTKWIDELKKKAFVETRI
ncbi:MAG: peptidylprolyl isomerase [Myxococcales bacterium]|nr:peptidylprolyl isomerase [Myxococcales bacterium]